MVLSTLNVEVIEESRPSTGRPRGVDGPPGQDSPSGRDDELGRVESITTPRS